MRAKDKLLLITGAGNGLGRELAQQLIARGARVIGLDLSTPGLLETQTCLGSNSHCFHGRQVNVADRDAVQSVADKVFAEFGAVDGIINCAGIIQPFTSVLKLDYAEIQRVIDVNLMGTLYVTKAFLERLLGRPEAHIVNIASMGGFLPVPGQTIYCATKAAVKMFTEGLAGELAGTNVRVTVVFPGAIATGIARNSGVAPAARPDSGRSGTRPLEAFKAADRIIKAMESNAERVQVGRDASLMDKLYRLRPSFASRIVAKKMKAYL